MANLAAIVIAHKHPQQVRKLLAALAGVDIFLHCDRRASKEVLAAMLEGAGPHVHAVRRVRATLSSWSLLEAELIALRAALERSAAEHVLVLSGSCYPLVSLDDLHEELAPWRGRSRLELRPLPRPEWSTPRNDDGGLWHFNRKFVTIRGQVVRVRDVPLRTVRRTIPVGLRLHASGAWKVYARAHAEALLRLLDERPDLVAFWRTSLMPSESAVASMLSSPELVGEIAETTIDDLVWYVDWSPGEDKASSDPPTWHPRWLTINDFEKLEAARRAPSRLPGDGGSSDDYRKLFARKFSPIDSQLLALVDEQLRA
jgi:hypothetical protein